MQGIKTAISKVVLCGVTCVCRMVHRISGILPPALRSKMFHRFGIPAFKQLLSPLSIETKRQILFGETSLSKEIVGRTGPVAENLALNETEWANGKTVLASSPPRLRIDLETKCNIRPPCVYCGFDTAKRAEALSNHSFQPETLTEMGAFFRGAEAVLDCSIGEPLMSPNFKPLVLLLDSFGKRFDLTTNGQLLRGRLQDVVLGKNMIVYVSLEAATAGLYSLYRNHRFHTVIDNLSVLCRKKQGFSNRPLIIVSHLAMRSNADKFEEFADLMGAVGVDAINIRALNGLPKAQSEERVRNGRRFVYQDEILNLSEFKAFVQRARMFTERKGMDFHTDLDFGEFRAHTARVPICDEPWKTLYFFKRGITPCCFGFRPLFRTSDQGDLSLEDFLWQVWNSAPYQEIRSYLARGEPAPYCVESLSCPVVQKRLS